MFQLESAYQPTGDQPQAIDSLVDGIRSGAKAETLLGVTGSGKTFTIANVIARLNRPTLILSHNKTLAAQLYSEMKAFFPHNAVEYFVSYYDYYQPEAYIPSTDTYIEKVSHELSKNHRVRVATSDGVEQMIILGNGAMRISATEFKKRCIAAEKAIKEYIDTMR